MPFISKTDRQSDYGLVSPGIPIVIDNGSSYCRIGWAGESDPRIVFRNIVQRPRRKVTGDTETVVGDQDPGLLKYYDYSHSQPRSAFEDSVVCQFEYMKEVLDFGFNRMGASGSEINHPVLITERVGNPVHSRSKMAELLFETYGVPSIAFGVDAAFSFKYNQRFRVCNKDSLVICPGFTTTHAIPFVDGEPRYEKSFRVNVGGFHITDNLRKLLSLKYPHHTASLTWEKVEDLKVEHCYIAHNYDEEARLFQMGGKEAGDKTRYWRLPTEEPPSEEEIARNAAIKKRLGQRLRLMAEVERSSRINELKDELIWLEYLLNQLEQTKEEDMSSFLSNNGYVSKQEIESAVMKATASLRKVKCKRKAEQSENDEKDNASTKQKYPLVNVPDNLLSPEQLKEKKRQVSLNSYTEAQEHARQKRFEELERVKRNQEEERRLENPELYLEQMRVKYKELQAKVEQQKRLKTNGGNDTNGNNTPGGVGRGERLNAAQRERVRLVEDTFGAKEEDWQLYKLMSIANDEAEDDEAELARISSRLQEIDPEFVPKPLQASSAEVPRPHPLTQQDFPLVIGVERFQCPEVLFDPSLIGIHEAGLNRIALASLVCDPSEDASLADRLTSSIFLTGGSCLLPGFNERLEAGIRMNRPCGAPIKIVKALDPVLDAWRGASDYAANFSFLQQTFSKLDYDEKGADWLREYHPKYTLKLF